MNDTRMMDSLGIKEFMEGVAAFALGILGVLGRRTLTEIDSRLDQSAKDREALHAKLGRLENSTVTRTDFERFADRMETRNDLKHAENRESLRVLFHALQSNAANATKSRDEIRDSIGAIERTLAALTGESSGLHRKPEEE